MCIVLIHAKLQDKWIKMEMRVKSVGQVERMRPKNQNSVT